MNDGTQSLFLYEKVFMFVNICIYVDYFLLAFFLLCCIFFWFILLLSVVFFLSHPMLVFIALNSDSGRK